MANFLLIAVCIVAGMLFRNAKVLPLDAHKGINAWIIYLALPAVSFKFLPHVHWTTELILPAMAPLIMFLVAVLAMGWYARLKNLDRASTGALQLAAGFSNTSFIGFPLCVAYFGEKALSIAIIFDQMHFMILSSGGIIVAINATQKTALSARIIGNRMLRFPPFLACVLALLLPLFINLEPIEPLFDKLAATVAPMALFSIGLQLKFKGWQQQIPHLSAALLYKLILAPIIITLIVLATGLKEMVAHISIFEAAMPTVLTAGIIAEEYDVNPSLTNLIIGVGIVVSFFTTALWWLVIHFWI